ncbi:relaxase/mobilization nuclease domain-containing protein [Dyadobacter sp. CY347]|uniref:relaxase/mobilization nuclease domain-containing protein n=1 Tax=Dyadobacter sp. CY347 TaxID=2909336 RepID=UPI001F259489|nr:relaxase/mobilization nuclease domain-containing protein [Dyadobacter sp. CY347]MCF2489688.1 relaxase/mobilization nuclease domain-containing protein [Dyadobacter sp. CY347]
MIAKTTIGSNFLGAINYGAGHSLDGKEIEGKSELLLLHNIVSIDPLGIAMEMQQEAAGSRCKRPVWHSSLSWKPNEKPTEEQMIEAANRYCTKMGADPKDHQIAVYQHNDKPHKHIHIYINRVPTDGSKALETSHNYARNVRICKEITQELGFAKVEKLEEGKLRRVAENQKEVQKFVNLAIREAFKKKCSSPEDLERQLKEKGIECKFTVEEGRLKYSSYSYRWVPIKGQDVGFTAKRLQHLFDQTELQKLKKPEIHLKR